MVMIFSNNRTQGQECSTLAAFSEVGFALIRNLLTLVATRALMFHT
jgi:hypothetical protein